VAPLNPANATTTGNATGDTTTSGSTTAANTSNNRGSRSVKKQKMIDENNLEAWIQEGSDAREAAAENEKNALVEAGKLVPAVRSMECVHTGSRQGQGVLCCWVPASPEHLSRTRQKQPSNITAEEYLAQIATRQDVPAVTLRNFAIAVIDATYHCETCYPESSPGKEPGCEFRDDMVITQLLVPTVDIDPEDT
jgi:hypothetical protein